MAANAWAVKTLTADGLIFTGRCIVHGIMVGTDGTNDVTVSLHNSVDNSGDKLHPTFTVDASADGYGGIMGMDADASTGCYLDLTISAGTCEVTVYFKRA